jgi:hypothetical protein
MLSAHTSCQIRFKTIDGTVEHGKFVLQVNHADDMAIGNVVLPVSYVLQ